jgi:hypothetical protein
MVPIFPSNPVLFQVLSWSNFGSFNAIAGPWAVSKVITKQRLLAIEPSVPLYETHAS